MSKKWRGKGPGTWWARAYDDVSDSLSDSDRLTELKLRPLPRIKKRTGSATATEAAEAELDKAGHGGRHSRTRTRTRKRKRPGSGGAPHAAASSDSASGDSGCADSASGSGEARKQLWRPVVKRARVRWRSWDDEEAAQEAARHSSALAHPLGRRWGRVRTRVRPHAGDPQAAPSLFVRRPAHKHLAPHLEVWPDVLPPPPQRPPTYSLRTLFRAHADEHNGDAVDPTAADVDAPVRAAAFMPSLDPRSSEPSIVATVGGTVVAFIDCVSRQVVKKVRPSGISNDDLLCLAWSILPGDDERIVLAVGSSAGTVYLISPELNIVHDMIVIAHETKPAITALAFHPSRSAWLASATDAGHVLIHDVAGRPVVVTACYGAPGPVAALAFSPTVPVLYAAGTTGVLSVWPIREDLVAHRPKWLQSMSKNARVLGITHRVDGWHAKLSDDSLGFLALWGDEGVITSGPDNGAALGYLVTVTADGALSVVPKFELVAATAPAFGASVSFAAGATFVATGPSITVFDRHLALTSVLATPASNGDVVAGVATSLHGRWVVGVGDNNSVWLWETRAL